MNANELADKLQEFDVYAEVVLVDKSGYPYADFDCITDIADEAATMLRKQQAEIERVKELCASYIKSDYEGTSMFKPMMEELYGKAELQEFVK